MAKPCLQSVKLAADVYAACLVHALSTEKEEIMGLLIGENDEEMSTSNITACIILHRSDKQPDRVEISPEQLYRASQYAENLENNLERCMRVVGWYHSHPHITVWPSHVDIKTQAMYQNMDPLFVGLIFSVFTCEGASSAANKVEVTCFQTTVVKEGSFLRQEIPLEIVPSPLKQYNLEVVIDLPRILTQELDTLSKETINDDEDGFTKLHNDNLLAIELAHIISKITKPLTEDFLEERRKAAETRIKALKLLKEKLLKAKNKIS